MQMHNKHVFACLFCKAPVEWRTAMEMFSLVLAISLYNCISTVLQSVPILTLQECWVLCWQTKIYSHSPRRSKTLIAYSLTQSVLDYALTSQVLTFTNKQNCCVDASKFDLHSSTLKNTNERNSAQIVNQVHLTSVVQEVMMSKSFLHQFYSTLSHDHDRHHSQDSELGQQNHVPWSSFRQPHLTQWY